MRVLCVTPSYPPRTGGGEKYAHRTNAELVRGGATVRVIASVFDLREDREIDGVDIDYVRAFRYGGFPWFSPLLLAREKGRFRPDLVLAYGPSPYDPIAASLFGLLGVPYVQVYHADFDERRFDARVATWIHNKVALALASAIVCTTATMQARLASRGFGNKTVLATPGIDDRFFDLSQRERNEDILFVAALDQDHAYKRLDLLFKAVALLREQGLYARVNVVGDGDCRAKFERDAIDLGLVDQIRFHGAIDDSDLSSLYSTSRVLVLPSPTQQEGFGLVCLEAMAAGLPVVCSMYAGAAEIVREGPGCSVWDGKTLESLARCIAQSRAAKDEKRSQLRSFVRKFSWCAMVSALHAQLSELIPAMKK